MEHYWDFSFVVKLTLPLNLSNLSFCFANPFLIVLCYSFTFHCGYIISFHLIHIFWTSVFIRIILVNLKAQRVFMRSITLTFLIELNILFYIFCVFCLQFLGIIKWFLMWNKLLFRNMDHGVQNLISSTVQGIKITGPSGASPFMEFLWIYSTGT